MGLVAAAVALGSALTVPAGGSPSGAAVEWTPVNATQFGYRLQLPCSEAQIAAYQQENDYRKKVGAVGCETKDYKAIAFVMNGMPPSFFTDLIAKSKDDRVPPFKLGTHDNLRIRDVPEKPGDKELLGQFTDLGGSRYLLISFETTSVATAVSHEVAEKLFNSLELQVQ